MSSAAAVKWGTSNEYPYLLWEVRKMSIFGEVSIGTIYLSMEKW